MVVVVGDAHYKFGFNGQEKVNEIAGIGNHTTALFWEYDTRLGRRWNRDPEEKNFPSLSPYATNNNNPIQYTDPNGDVGIAGAVVGFVIGGGLSLTKSVIQNGWGTLKDSKTWSKAGVNALGGAVVGATGGMGAGLVATAATSFGTSLAEDAIDGNELDYGKAGFSSFVSTATFGAAKYGADKLSKVVTRSWWNRGYTNPFGKYSPGNTSGFMRWLGKSPSTNVGLLMDRISDAAGVGVGLSVDKLFPNKNAGQGTDVIRIQLDNVNVSGERVNGQYKPKEESIEQAGKEVYQNMDDVHQKR